MLPGADSFQAQGASALRQGYRSKDGKQKLVGYIFFLRMSWTSRRIRQADYYPDRHGYAGPFTGSRILKHSEPILLLGIPRLH